MNREHRIEISQKVRYVHFHCEGGGGVTVATARHPDNPSVGLFGFSFCSPKDQFTKARGRKIAFTRLMEGLRWNVPWTHNGEAPPIITFCVLDTGNPERPHERSLKALKEIQNHKMLPQWFPKADIAAKFAEVSFVIELPETQPVL